MIFHWFGELYDRWEERKDHSDSELFLKKYRHGCSLDCWFTLSLFDVVATDTGILEGKGANASSQR